MYQQINKSNLDTLVPDDKDLDENAHFFAQVGGSGYTNNFFSAGSKDMFYDKLDTQLVLNLIEKFRYNRVQKDRTSKIYGPPKFSDGYEITYQDLGNMLRHYEEYCKDMNKKFNKNIPKYS